MMLNGSWPGPAHGDAVSHGGDLLQRHQGVGGQRRRVSGGVFGLDADDADFPAQFPGPGLDGNRDAGQQAAAANAHQDGVDVGDLLEDFQADGALAGHHVHVVEGVDKDGSGFIRVALRLGERLVHVVAVQDHLRAVAAGGGQLGQGHAQRHVDAGLDAEAFGCHGHALRVVAGGGRHNAALLFLRATAWPCGRRRRGP